MAQVAVCSGMNTKHINTICGQNVQLLNVKLLVHGITSRLWMVNMKMIFSSTISVLFHRPTCYGNTPQKKRKNTSLGFGGMGLDYKIPLPVAKSEIPWIIYPPPPVPKKNRNSFNFMRCATKLWSIYTKILILLDLKVSEWHIFILGGGGQPPQVCETSKYLTAKSDLMSVC
jgi:hypothetical protein